MPPVGVPSAPARQTSHPWHRWTPAAQQAALTLIRAASFHAMLWSFRATIAAVEYATAGIFAGRACSAACATGAPPIKSVRAASTLPNQPRHFPKTVGIMSQTVGLMFPGEPV